MSKIDRTYLEPDETIEFSEKQSLFGSLLAIVWFSLTLMGSVIIFIASYLGRNTFYTLAVFYFMISLPALFIILNNLSTVYAITNKRVIIRSGIFKARLSSASYENVASVNSLETALGKHFGFSTIIIGISGLRRNNEFLWKYTKSGPKVKNLLETRILSVSQKK